jgi:hypothetical protein
LEDLEADILVNVAFIMQGFNYLEHLDAEHAYGFNGELVITKC